MGTIGMWKPHLTTMTLMYIVREILIDLVMHVATYQCYASLYPLLGNVGEKVGI